MAVGGMREAPEPGNIGRYVWPLMVGGLLYGVAAARAQKGWTPLVAAGIGAYAVNKAMVNQRDFVSFAISPTGVGGRDFIPF